MILVAKIGQESAKGIKKEGVPKMDILAKKTKKYSKIRCMKSN